VTPAFKTGEHYDPANYRPVSLTSLPGKILEHIVVGTLMTHLNINNIHVLCDQQHDFRKGGSCETQLIEFAEDLNKPMAEGLESEVVIMGFAKASDKVNHSLLIHKVRYYGVQGCVNKWIN